MLPGLGARSLLASSRRDLGGGATCPTVSGGTFPPTLCGRVGLLLTGLVSLQGLGGTSLESMGPSGSWSCFCPVALPVPASRMHFTPTDQEAEGQTLQMLHLVSILVPRGSRAASAAPGCSAQPP